MGKLTHFIQGLEIMSDYLSAFRKNTRAKLDALGWKDNKLAAEAKIDPSSLSKYLKGEQNPSLIVIERVAAALENTPVWQLLKPEATPAISDDLIEQAVALMRTLDRDGREHALEGIKLVAKIKAKKKESTG